jgi:Lar family restriction alleviation protein
MKDQTLPKWLKDMPKEDIELKPCPFCGGEAKIHTRESFPQIYYAYAECSQCLSTSPTVSAGDTEQKKKRAAEFWNTRV